MGRKLTKKGEKKKKDSIWKTKVKERDNYTCQMCKKQHDTNSRGIAAHHLLPRIFTKYRWDVNNGITLCAYCHHWGKWAPHQNPVFFTLWLQQNFPNSYNYVVIKLKEERE